ncbi:hypothetical protein [Massilia sp. CFBP9026]|uniref:hypothetical protein n=1 Tax=Massilia sp. CFBP9026 TaxID=3096536 RepID=UPI002A69997D|nr:hypothetical protein [Massilia sp. CFBP9026]MDY0961597.1 hypothetical protein [Massilia sp. CFBP9026]
MARTPLVRIAYVQFGPGGKSYPTRCHRPDIGAGQAVTVLMRAGTPGEYWMDGFVTDIGFQRWSCSSHTLHRADEAPGFRLVDDVPPSSSSPAQAVR